MIKLFARIADKAPTADAFHIHQVVRTFHNNICRYVRPNSLPQLSTRSSTHNKGIHATKIKNVKVEGGHAAQSRIPPRMEAKKNLNRFKKRDFCLIS